MRAGQILPFILFLLIFNFCDSTEPEALVIPPPPEISDTLSISVTDVTHRSVYIGLSNTMNNRDLSVHLFRRFGNKDTLVCSFPVVAPDTVIFDDRNGEGLSVDTDYGYYSFLFDSAGTKIDSTPILTVKTLAPTSHKYVWQETVIGDPGYLSIIEDVWGIDENNVWVVGTIKIEGKTYGVIKWDGAEWKGDELRGGVEAIYGFSSSNIWIAGTAIRHFDGTNWTRIDSLDPVLSDNRSYRSLWGTSSNDLYFGSYRGKLIHWDGSKAREVYSFEGTSITDIYGKSSKRFYIAGPRNTASGNNIVAFFDNSNIGFINEPQLINNFPRTIFQIDENSVYLGGNDLYVKKGNQWLKEPLQNRGIILKIRGNNSNDIFSVGFFKEAYHYNGIDWHFYEELKADHGNFTSVFVTENKVFIVGNNETYNRGIIVTGTKIN